MKFNYVFAYTNGNLGDDLFLYILCNRYNNELFYVETDFPESITRLGISNLNAINKDCFLYKAERKLFSTSYFKRFFAFIHGGIKTYIQIGGSFFMEEQSWEINLRRHNRFLKKGIPYYLLGCNFGPYKSEYYKNTWKKQFVSYEDVCFRDSKSYKLFTDLDNTRLSNDIVFSLKTYLSPVAIPKKRVSISVINFANRDSLKDYEIIYFEKLCELTKHYLNLDYEVILLSFCPNEGDTIAAEKIKMNTSETVKILEYCGNIEFFITEIISSKLLVATRFHAMILGFLFRVPVLPIIYSEKMLSVLKDINFEGYTVSIENMNDLDLSKVCNTCSIVLDDIKYDGPFSLLDKHL